MNAKSFVVVILMIAACTGHNQPPQESSAIGEDQMQINDLKSRHSGYDPDSADWSGFLTCWTGEMKSTPSEASSTVLQLLEKPLAIGESNVKRIQLPRSFIDFISALDSFTSESSSMSGSGFYRTADVALLKDINPSYLQAVHLHAIEAGDDLYFRYGIEQDDAAGRFTYLRNALVVGKYNADSFGYIVLYPDSRTADDEMEAALIFHSGEYRAPSFAELVRQLSYMEIKRPTTVPPYAQSSLDATCASLIRLRDVWWR